MKEEITLNLLTLRIPAPCYEDIGDLPFNERGNKMIIYQISLPQKQDAEAFVTFMREEYFPAVHKGATRTGQVTNLVLLQEEPAGATKGCEFFWHVGWDGLAMGGARVDAEPVIRKFESFKASIKRLGSYAQVAAWTG